MTFKPIQRLWAWIASRRIPFVLQVILLYLGLGALCLVAALALAKWVGVEVPW